MFGAIAFMLDGNMLVATMKDGALLVRTGKEAQAEALTRPGAGVMSMTGRIMSGYVQVSGDALEDDEDLQAWIEIALAFVRTLPPRSKGGKGKD
ncbi:MAG: TfoX/Sxy family protein [Alphaproteobacteria bacterium]|nr:TfoX/Sxy family protein [Alphaproteobacteria bacterium]